MSIVNQQLAQTPSYGDFPFHNYGVTDIVPNVAVKVDASNDLSANSKGIGIAVIATAATDAPIGVTLETIPAGGSGRVRTQGIVQMFADGAITAGAYVDASATSLKVGFAKAHVSGQCTVGIALNATTSDSDLVLVLLALGDST